MEDDSVGGGCDTFVYVKGSVVYGWSSYEGVLGTSKLAL